MTDNIKDIAQWVDSQTEQDLPAVLLIYEKDEDSGYIYLSNAPHFDMPVIIALDVPRNLAIEIGHHIDFLCEEHMSGNPIKGGQTSSKQMQDGIHFLLFRLVEPPAGLRKALLKEELNHIKLRWPKTKVLLLMPEVPENLIDTSDDDTPTIH